MKKVSLPPLSHPPFKKLSPYAPAVNVGFMIAFYGGTKAPPYDEGDGIANAESISAKCTQKNRALPMARLEKYFIYLR